MKSILFRVAGLVLFVSALPVNSAPGAAAPGPQASCSGVLDTSARRLMGGEAQLCQYSGQLVMVVNTASHCGYTGQYAGLEALYKKYRERGLVILGFPSGDFGGQEFADGEQIAQFCKVNFGVSFPMFAKIKTVGAEAHPLFRQLTAISGSAPAWNFHKYLIDRSGKVQAFDSDMTPQKLEPLIERALGTGKA